MTIGLGKIVGLGLLSQFMGGGKGLLGNQEEDKIQSIGEYNQPPTQATNNTNQGFGGFGGIVSGVSNQLFKGMSQEQVARLGMGFNSMRLDPDPNMAASFQNTIDTASANTGKANAVGALRKMGKTHLADLVESGGLGVTEAMKRALDDPGKTDINASLALLRKDPNNAQLLDLAEILEADGTMHDDVMKAYMDIKGLGSNDKEYALGLSEMMTYQGKDLVDENGKSREGQHYQIQTDKATGDIKQVWLPSYGETIEQKQTRENEQAFLIQDQETATKMGNQAYSESRALRSQISQFELALQAVDDGALSGFLARRLPAIDDKTALLFGLQNKLGISVINSATFGALSEREMQMAMATNLNLDLPPAELRDMIIEQIRVRRKLAQAFETEATSLLGGGKSWSDFVARMVEETKKHDAVVWEQLKPNEVEALLKVGIDREAYKDLTYEERKGIFDRRTN